jgi:hypothetical protein
MFVRNIVAEIGIFFPKRIKGGGNSTPFYLQTKIRGRQHSNKRIFNAGL